MMRFKYRSLCDAAGGGYRPSGRRRRRLLPGRRPSRAPPHRGLTCLGHLSVIPLAPAILSTFTFGVSFWEQRGSHATAAVRRRRLRSAPAAIVGARLRGVPALSQSWFVFQSQSLKLPRSRTGEGHTLVAYKSHPHLARAASPLHTPAQHPTGRVSAANWVSRQDTSVWRARRAGGTPCSCQASFCALRLAPLLAITRAHGALALATAAVVSVAGAAGAGSCRLCAAPPPAPSLPLLALALPCQCWLSAPHAPP